MAASRPGFGPVTDDVVFGASVLAALNAGTSRRTRDGSWRPDKPFLTGDGLKVTMRRAAGLTPEDVLTVPLRFQVPPTGDLARAYHFSWGTWDTVSAGQQARPGGRQLLEVSIDTLLMDRLAADASSGVVVWDGAADPQRMLEELRWIAGVDDAARGPAAAFRLVINQPAVWPKPIVNMVAVLTAVEPRQQAGSLATEYLSATFMQLPPEEVQRRQRTTSKPKVTHTLAGGDTLYALAVRYVHQASLWRNIAAANGITGVSPHSAADLAAWAKRHHKRKLVIPTVYTTGVTSP
jgi:hypothetical protein